MWIPPHPSLEHLEAVDPDVEPVEARRRDLGVPDAIWWVGTVATALVAGLPLFGALFRGLGRAPAQCAFAGYFFAVWVFAGERWGHRRYRLGRALRDAARPLAAGLAAALLALLAARLGWHRPHFW